MARAADATARTTDAVDPRIDDPVSSLSGVGPKRVELLARLGIHTRRDLVLHFPRRYEDRRVVTPIAEVHEGDRVTVIATVVSSRAIRLRGRMTLAEVVFDDGTGKVKAIWFGRGFLAKTFQPGTRAVLSGEVGVYKGMALRNPDFDMLRDGEAPTLGILPVYPATEGLSQRLLRDWIRRSLDEVGGQLRSVVPTSANLSRSPETDAPSILHAVHYPSDPEEAEGVRRRFAYEELFVVQSAVLQERAKRRTFEGIAHTDDGPCLRGLADALPYTLTQAQEHAVRAILDDMTDPKPMARLLQGDVGCGKTAVAMHAIAACLDSGHQAALMAPTEVLAAQHHRTLNETFAPLGVPVALLTASSDPSTRREIAAGAWPIVVGTHALFQDATTFRRLGLVIVDEQHRFGVNQRDRLAEKGVHPDVLHMTATPIPRSLALTLYGAMDLTLVRERPPGRARVKTRLATKSDEEKVFCLVRDRARENLQTYMVCPLIEAGKRGASDVKSRFAQLASGPWSDLRCALLHGRLDSQEKDSTLERFRHGEIDVLVSTTVIEVGVDAPRAAIMIIEDAAQFGLSQLHQLRGRIGRGAHPGTCFLMHDDDKETCERLQILCETDDGFRIAEEDFRLRGPGQLHGERQSGLDDLRIARLPRDLDMLEHARKDAAAWLENDPALRRPESHELAEAVAAFTDLVY